MEPVRLLRAAGHDPTIAYMNSNIAPADEYAHRLSTLRAWAAGEQLNVLEGAEQGFDALGTTLSVSPYQYTDVIREELERAAAAAGVQPLFEDYRPFYDEATHRSRELGMYRQNYCGCRFSDAEAAAERAERKAQRAAQREAEAAAHAEERAAAEAERRAKKAERAAYDAKQARKRAVLKALREQERDGKQASHAGADGAARSAQRHNTRP